MIAELETEQFILSGQSFTVRLMELSAAFAAWLQEQVEARGMTIPELAERIGVSKTTLYNYANGETDFPRKTTLAKIEAGLGAKFPVPERRPPPDIKGGHPQPDTVHLSGVSLRAVDAIDLRAMEEIPLDTDGDAFMAAIRLKSYGKVSTDSSAPELFAVRLPVAMGPFVAGQRLTINRNLEPEPEEHVLVRARGRRQFGTFQRDDDGHPAVMLWSGGLTRDYTLIGTVIEASHSTLKRPR